MPCCIKRIMLKSGELVSEKELGTDENRFEGPHLLFGDIVAVACRGRTIRARVVAWRGRQVVVPTGVIVPLRVEEI
jgi:hypothetical protein